MMSISMPAKGRKIPQMESEGMRSENAERVLLFYRKLNLIGAWSVHWVDLMAARQLL